MKRWPITSTRLFIGGSSVPRFDGERYSRDLPTDTGSRVERGYYVFACPVGYRYEKCGSHGRMLVKDEPLASSVQDALKGFASGRFDIQAEVKRWLEAQPKFPKVHRRFRIV